MKLKCALSSLALLLLLPTFAGAQITKEDIKKKHGEYTAQLTAQLSSLVSRQGIPHNATSSDLCQEDWQCNHGKCVFTRSSEFPSGRYECDCNACYSDRHQQFCNYAQQKKLAPFLISFLVGLFGVDWFYLSDGNPLYIGVGVLKLISLGGCGIWWVVDWVRILADAFPDGNHQHICKNWA